ncbi:site-specific integrase [Pseudomonas putida]|uniref:site-specific integrase n=1 Tax=Pseudomonas putida TaxID=303 RepID=UPI00300E9E35
MAYRNEANEGRLILLPVLEDLFATLHVEAGPPPAYPVPLAGTDREVFLYQEPEVGSVEGFNRSFNVPFLFHADGTPWIEANSFLYSELQNKSAKSRPTDETRKLASELLEYLRFCEKEGIDWKDFSGDRPSLRPTYRYFNHLKTGSSRKNRVNNQYTGAVYRMFEFISENWHDIKLDRVDKVKKYKHYISTSHGSVVAERLKRSQTLPTPPESVPDYGKVRDDGEDLRPLTNDQLKNVRSALMENRWDTDHRLMIDFALMTGARKQTVLTLRHKHIRSFQVDQLNSNNTYALRAGPGTGIDTKFDTNVRLEIPKGLGERLAIWIDSPESKKRQRKFRKILRSHNVDDLPDGDEYVFLSDQGNCYYMSKDDSRYPEVKSTPRGQVTQTIVKKLRRLTAGHLPKDFTFHWLRATFGYQLFQYLQPAIQSGHLKPGDDISIIQRRMSHKYRETTENYLKLFRMFDENMAAQEDWEGWMMRGYSPENSEV